MSDSLLITGLARALSGQEAIDGILLAWFKEQPAANVASGCVIEEYDPCYDCHVFTAGFDSWHWTGLHS